MIYRMRTYKAIPEKMPEFHQFFREHLLPIQLRHGARLVGRWETDDTRVVAIWEYDDLDAYRRIDRAVIADAASAVARKARAGVGPLYSEYEETMMSPTPTLSWPARHPIPVAGAIVRRDDEILLVRPHDERLHWLISGYHKLVRDRIPELIRRNGGEPLTRRLSDEEFATALARKLVEVADEFAATPTTEELADVLEVVHALAQVAGVSDDEVEALRRDKAAERGL